MSSLLPSWIYPNQTKILKAPSFEGASLFQRHPHREGTGGGVLRGYGYRQPERQDIQGHRFTGGSRETPSSYTGPFTKYLS